MIITVWIWLLNFINVKLQMIVFKKVDTKKNVIKWFLLKNTSC